jgi:Na+/H+ antiporter NhaD/arsenite permease-like protein
MVTVSSTVTPAMWIAGSILVGAYVLIFSELIHRTLAGIIGAVTMILAGTIGGFYSQAEAVAAIDANTMFLLTGMMTLVVLLKPTGGFEYLAIRMAKLSRGSQRRLLIYISTAYRSRGLAGHSAAFVSLVPYPAETEDCGHPRPR